MSGVSAWLLHPGGGIRVAVGLRELLHVIDGPRTFVVPRTRPHCRSVLSWEGRLLPVADLAALLDDAAPLGTHRFAAVIGYRDPGDEEVRFGAISLLELPTKLALSDIASCELPHALQPWRPFVHACFDHDGAVPVLHAPSLFRRSG